MSEVVQMRNEVQWQEYELRPGMVPTGFSEMVLSQIDSAEDIMFLWNGSARLAGEAQRWNGHGAEKREIKSAQMFCEIVLGQLLGPNPGEGSNYDAAAGGFVQSPYADTGLPRQRMLEFRRYHGWKPQLVEAVRNGATSRRSLLLLVDQWITEQTEPPTIEQLNIQRGDFREVFASMKPNSIQLILTDPPYPEQYLPLWSDLGQFAAKCLVDGGSLVAYSGQASLPQVLSRLDEHLRYWWTLAQIHGQSQMLPGKFVSVGWKPVLWYVKNSRNSNTMVADTLRAGMARKTIATGDDGSWAQSVDSVLPIISMLTSPGDIIVDPFAGSGSFGIAAVRSKRQFIGADING